MSANDTMANHKGMKRNKKRKTCVNKVKREYKDCLVTAMKARQEKNDHFDRVGCGATPAVSKLSKLNTKLN